MFSRDIIIFEGDLFAPKSEGKLKVQTLVSKFLDAAKALRKGIVLEKFSNQILAQNFSRIKRVGGFTGQQWAVEADRMMRSDAKLFGAIQQLKNSMLSASWYIESADPDDPECERNANFIRRALGLDGEQCHLKSASFEAELRKVLDFVFIGHQECEEVFYEHDGEIWLGEIADISPASVLRWNYDHDGELVSITQVATSREISLGYTPPAEVQIEAERLQIYTLNRKGLDYEGCGILSPCFVWWQMKDALINFLNEGGEKWSVPTIILTVDRELLTSMSYTADDIDVLLSKACEAAKNYRGGAEGFIAVPQGINVQVFGGGSFDPTKVIASIEHCNQEMAAAFLTNFLELGISTEGNRNVGEIHWNSYKTSIANILDIVADVWNGCGRVGGGTIAKLLQFNFYGAASAVPIDKLPRLRHRGVDVDALSDSLGNLPQLAASGFLTPDDAIEIKLRRLFGIAEKASDQDEQVRLARMHSSSVGSESPLRESEGGRPVEKGVGA